MANRRQYAKRWCFTLNNPTENETATILKSIKSLATQYCIVANELSSTKTKHLQGYVHLAQRKTFATIKRILSHRCHVEMARGTDAQNKSYCSKGGDILIELGQPMSGTTENGGGATTTEAAIRVATALAQGVPLHDIVKQSDQATAFLRHSKAISSIADSIRSDSAKALARSEMAGKFLRQWQLELINELREKPHERSIIWYKDSIGNTGKTWLSKLLCCEFDCIRFENGKSADIKHAFNGQKIVIFDLSRSQSEHVNYEVIESVKNGFLFSPKYESCSKMYAIPHVIVFSNFMYDESKLSLDRWVLRTTFDCTLTVLTITDVLKQVKKEKPEPEIIVISDDDDDDKTVLYGDDVPPTDSPIDWSFVTDWAKETDRQSEEDKQTEYAHSFHSDMMAFIDENGGGQPDTDTFLYFRKMRN